MNFEISVKLRPAQVTDFRSVDPWGKPIRFLGLRYWLLNREDKLEQYRFTEDSDSAQILTFIKVGRCFVIEEEDHLKGFSV